MRENRIAMYLIDVPKPQVKDKLVVVFSGLFPGAHREALTLPCRMSRRKLIEDAICVAPKECISKWTMG